MAAFRCLNLALQKTDIIIIIINIIFWGMWYINVASNDVMYHVFSIYALSDSQISASTTKQTLHTFVDDLQQSMPRKAFNT